MEREAAELAAKWEPRINDDMLFFTTFLLHVIIACEHGNGEQRRKHRKHRINKKWLKRYGVWSGQPLDKDKAVYLKGEETLLVTRDMYRRIKEAAKKEYKEKYGYFPCLSNEPPGTYKYFITKTSEKITRKPWSMQAAREIPTPKSCSPYTKTSTS